MFKNIRLHYVFIYLTERCNLSCRYCYFKDKRGRSLAEADIADFISFLKENFPSRPSSFIISGGEPLLLWPLFRKTVALLRREFYGVPVGLQTNGTLLDKPKLDFMKKNGIHLEIGLDGDFASMRAYRRGMHAGRFKRLIGAIHQALGQGVDVSCTMTVPPRGIQKMPLNFHYLKKTGLKKIDVTPAAFMDWDDAAMRQFKRTYLGLVSSRENLERMYTSEDLLFLKDFTLDLSLHPPGYVFCGDVYLCLPERLRKKYTLARKSRPRRLSLNRAAFLLFLRKYKKYYARLKAEVTYRDYVSFGFRIINELSGREYLNSGTMIEFQDFFKTAHRSLKPFDRISPPSSGEKKRPAGNSRG